MDSVRLGVIIERCIVALWQYRFVVRLCVCDGASENRAWQKEICTQTARHFDASLPDDINVAFEHPCTGESVVCISDTPHGIKKIVNAMESSNETTRGKRDMRMVVTHTDAPGQEVTRVVPINLEQLHGVYLRSEKSEHKNALLVQRRLSDANFLRTPHTRMNVSLSARVLSNTMVVMCDREIDGRDSANAPKGPSFGRGDSALALLGVREVCRVFNRFQDIMNGRPDASHPGWIAGPDDSRLDELIHILSFVDKWKADINLKYHDQPKSVQQLFFLPYQCYFDIRLICAGFVAFCKHYLRNGHDTLRDPSDGKFRVVQPKRCNQDVIENHFGHVRDHGGSQRHPTQLGCETASDNAMANRSTGHAQRCVMGSNVAGGDEHAGNAPVNAAVVLVRGSRKQRDH
jgi:hypothetical protein